MGIREGDFMKKLLMGRCMKCEKKIYDDEFKDIKSLEKFSSAGLCLVCQKKEKKK